MSGLFKKPLTLAVLSSMAVNTALAAGTDRSGQDISPFLQNGTYAEFVYTYLDPRVSGYDNGVQIDGVNIGAKKGEYVKGNYTGNGGETYDFFRFAIKADINDRYSIGVLYDEPFGASVRYEGDSNFIAQGADVTRAALTAAGYSANTIKNTSASAEKNKGEGTNVEIRTHNLTTLLGAKLGKDKKWQVYGGPALQRLTGESHLRGIVYQGANGYDSVISPDVAVGWVAGLAYTEPKKGFKAAVTYRSEIEHNTSISEVFPAVGISEYFGTIDGASTKPYQAKMPESVNIDVQKALNRTTVLSAKFRYVPWTKYESRPPTYGMVTAVSNNGIPLAISSYRDDQYSGEIGLGKALNQKWSVSGSVGYDSGAGSPIGTLGPVDGYYSVGLGAKYNVTPEWSVSVGGKYLKFGDATGVLPTGARAGDFSDNEGFAGAIKLVYQKR